ncbi:MAG: Ig-like domain-containing protein, partial [Desulfobacterales bacterium]|nr:Ig-like domain-containing protein [Desulfobacterales bacterium]
SLNAEITIPAGCFSNDINLTLTKLSQQALTFPLPIGWTPVSAFYIGPTGNSLNSSFDIIVSKAENIGSTPLSLIAVKWDSQTLKWIQIPSSFYSNTNQIIIATDSMGCIALVKPDVLPYPAVIPGQGSPIEGVNPADLPEDVIITISPNPTILFMQPGIKSLVSAVLNGDLIIPSGTPIQIDFKETYNYVDGNILSLEPSTHDVLFFQNENRLEALFSASPSLNFNPSELSEGKIILDAHNFNVPSATGIVSPSGGMVSDGVFSVKVLSGSITTDAPIILQPISDIPLDLSQDPYFEIFPDTPGISIDFGCASLLKSAILSVKVSSQFSSNDSFVLVKQTAIENSTRYELVAIGRIDSNNIIFDSLNMPLIQGSGKYYILKMKSSIGYITGTVSHGSNVFIETSNLPFVSMANPDTGSYKAIALTGSITVNAKDITSGYSTYQNTYVTANFTANVALTLKAVRPTVLAISPEDEAEKIELTAPILVNFSAKMSSSSINSSSFKLLEGEVGINGVISLDPDGRTAVFRPNLSLNDNKKHTVILTTEIKDIYGNALIGNQSNETYSISFTTLDATPPAKPAPGQIKVPIPENGETVVTGTQGATEPGTLVNVFNLTTGATTSVISEDDGSFYITVQADLVDKLQVEIRDESGNITIFDPGPFRNDDGSTVVGSEGGVVEGSGDVTLIVPEDAIPDGTIVKIDALDESQVEKKIEPFFTPFGYLKLEMGDVVASKELKVSIPAPAGMDLTQFTDMLVVQEVDFFGTKEHELINIAKINDGRIETASPPFCGLLTSGVYALMGSVMPLAYPTFNLSSLYSGISVISIMNDSYFTLVSLCSKIGMTLQNKPAKVTAYNSAGNIIAQQEFYAPVTPYASIDISHPQNNQGVFAAINIHISSDSTVTQFNSDLTVKDIITGININAQAAVIFSKEIKGVSNSSFYVSENGANIPGTVEVKYP